MRKKTTDLRAYVGCDRSKERRRSEYTWPRRRFPMNRVAARMMGMVDATMPRYQGCMITRSDEGAGAIFAGVMMHLMLRAFIAIPTAWAFAAIGGTADGHRGVIVALRPCLCRRHGAADDGPDETTEI